MHTTYLVGTPKGNDYRALEDPALPIQAELLQRWIMLGDAQMQPDQVLLKLARYRHEDGIYTWLGLYSHATELDARRVEGSYVGAGLLLRDKLLPPEESLRIVHDVHHALRQLVVKNGRFRRTLNDFAVKDLLLPLDMGADYAAIAAARQLDPERGLRPEGERVALRDPFILVDLEWDRFVPACIQWAQTSTMFDKVQQVYLSQSEAGTEPPLGTYVEMASRLQRDGHLLGYVEPPPPSPPLSARSLATPPPMPLLTEDEWVLPRPPPVTNRTGSGPPTLAQLANEVAALRARLDRLPDGSPAGSTRARLSKATWATLMLATVGLVMLGMALQWILTRAPSAPLASAPTETFRGTSTGTRAAPQMEDMEALAVARDYYQAIADRDYLRAARMRGLTDEHAARLSERHDRFEAYVLGNFRGERASERRIIVAADINARLADGSMQIGRANVVLERDVDGDWAISRATEAPAGIALLPQSGPDSP